MVLLALLALLAPRQKQRTDKNKFRAREPYFHLDKWVAVRSVDRRILPPEDLANQGTLILGVKWERAHAALVLQERAGQAGVACSDSVGSTELH